MASSTLRFGVVLGLLSAIGPFAIDMYLPALPTISGDLHASTAAVQLSLMAFFLAVAVSQLIYGPLADMLGRKTPLYFGLGLFILASIGCSFATNIEMLILFRFIQGVGACGPMVIPRAIVRDLHTGTEAARLMSLLMLVFSVSPILAPLAGSGIIHVAGWRGVFWAVTIVGSLGLVLLALALPETRPAADRVESGVRSAIAGYRRLIVDWHFLGLTLIGAFGISGFFVFLANSSFVYIDHYGLTPTQYSFAFSVNAISFIGVSQLNGLLGGRFGLVRVMKLAVTGLAVIMVALLAVVMAGFDQLLVLSTFLFFGFGCLGLIVPTSAVLALDEHGAIAGTASALMGTIQFMVGGAVIAIVGQFFDGTATAMVIGIAGSAVATFITAQWTLRRPRAVEAPVR